MKYTPAPWFSVDYCGFLNIQTKDQYSPDDNLLNAEDFENYEANGTMAAAAPEMYEALKFAKQQLQSIGYDDSDKVIIDINAAMLKANP